MAKPNLANKKSRRSESTRKGALVDSNIDWLSDSALRRPAIPPARKHDSAYHRPLLLDEPESVNSLLTWYDTTSEDRSMPWRKPWLDPATYQDDSVSYEKALSRRAYEVWVSEIMLQQTRVSTVIEYFNKWIAKWPTVEALAGGSSDEVLAAWKGLGYYSRATRLHEAAQDVVKHRKGVIPSTVSELLDMKGVGPYTAGAIASIAYGKPAPLLDGNVWRVLSRQTGLFATLKEPGIEKALWAVLELLMQTVAKKADTQASDVPGRWNQAIMELGATICTPQPKCKECPIRPTCRAYAEGKLLATVQKDNQTSKEQVVDIEDGIDSDCHMCTREDLDEMLLDGEDATDAEPKQESKTRKRAATNTTLPTRPSKTQKNTTDPKKQRTLQSFASFASHKPKPEDPPPKPPTTVDGLTEQEYKTVITYCSSFPKKEPKKNVPEQDCIVCIVRRGSRELVEQRPAKGLLASLWQYPTLNLANGIPEAEEERGDACVKFVRDMLDSRLLESGKKGGKEIALGEDVEVRVRDKFAPITHVFTHLKLIMYVYTLDLECSDEIAESIIKGEGSVQRWVDVGHLDEVTFSTGMLKCVKAAHDQ